MKIGRFNVQNGNLLELKVDVENEEVITISQISYDNKGKLQEHGFVTMTEWAFESIVKEVRGRL